MDSSWNWIVVGAGIAGASAATYLAERGRVLLIEADAPASGASGAAPGLVNPFMGRRARPAWRLDEALEALDETLARADAAELFYRTGVLRIPREASLAEEYRQRAVDFPEQTTWLPPEAVDERYPQVDSAHGALLVRTGGFVDIPAAVRQMVWSMQSAGGRILTPGKVTGWGTTASDAYVVVDRFTRLHAEHVILAPGAGFNRFSQLEPLQLRGVKGQSVTIRRPAGLGDLPCLSGFGYAAPDARTLRLGSTYEHEFSNRKPSPQKSREIIDRVARMLPAIRGADIVDAHAGIRVMTPSTNKAMIGPLPGQDRIWFFGGLGSKGLLMGPMMARQLPRWLGQPDAIPPKLRTNST